MNCLSSPIIMACRKRSFEDEIDDYYMQVDAVDEVRKVWLPSYHHFCPSALSFQSISNPSFALQRPRNDTSTKPVSRDIAPLLLNPPKPGTRPSLSRAHTAPFRCASFQAHHFTVHILLSPRIYACWLRGKRLW